MIPESASSHRPDACCRHSRSPHGGTAVAWAAICCCCLVHLLQGDAKSIDRVLVGLQVILGLLHIVQALAQLRPHGLQLLLTLGQRFFSLSAPRLRLLQLLLDLGRRCLSSSAPPTQLDCIYCCLSSLSCELCSSAPCRPCTGCMVRCEERSSQHVHTARHSHEAALMSRQCRTAVLKDI